MAGRAVFVVAAKRTPFGTFGGKLKGFTATDLCKVAATAALEAGNVPPEAVDSVIIGNVAQVSPWWSLVSLQMCSLRQKCSLREISFTYETQKISQ